MNVYLSPECCAKIFFEDVPRPAGEANFDARTLRKILNNLTEICVVSGILVESINEEAEPRDAIRLATQCTNRGLEFGQSPWF